MAGPEWALPLKDYTVKGSMLKRSKRCERKGIVCSTECSSVQEMRDVSDEWLSSKSFGREQLFGTLPPCLPSVADGSLRGAATTSEVESAAHEVRRVFAYENGRLVGFACAEPYYGGVDGTPRGYVLNGVRFRKGYPDVSGCLLTALIKNLREEGHAEFLALGYSPMSEMRPHFA